MGVYDYRITRAKQIELLAIGFGIGFLLALLIAGAVFKAATPVDVKIYEDGSFSGCTSGKLCDK